VSTEPSPQKDADSEDDGVIAEVRADLDVPGETGRQAKIFVVWLACLVLAVIVSSSVGAHIPMSAAGTELAEQELSRSRAAKAKVAVSLGLALPILLTIAVNFRYRRGGAHARGIIVDVTDDGELRVWGRGYGSRLVLRGATATERLVDVYAGRLGAWRQRRLRVRAGLTSTPGAREIELATMAVASDSEGELGLFGGEGDCIELRREDYELVRTHALKGIENR
jgi:hypothetical protein